MNRGQVIFTGVIFFLLATSIFVVWFLLPKTGFIKTKEVYDEFKLKKELEQKLKKVEEGRAHTLDSLRTELGILSEEITAKKLKEGEMVNKFNFLRKQYLSKQEENDQLNQALSQQYSEQIWKQLNQYIKEYGEKNGYDYIYGTHGEGNLMFAKESRDVTAGIKEYVNNKYEGNEK